MQLKKKSVVFIKALEVSKGFQIISFIDKKWGFIGASNTEKKFGHIHTTDTVTVQG